MKWKCPHGEHVEEKIIFGMTIYVHERTGKACSILSKFSTGVGDVDKAQYKRMSEKDRDGRLGFALCESDYAVRRTVRSFNKIRDHVELEHKLLALSRSGELIHLHDKLARVFGQVYLENIRRVFGGSAVAPKGMRKSGRKGYSMLNIHAEILAGAAKAASEVGDRAKRSIEQLGHFENIR